MLNALYKNCIFRSQERMETHAVIAHEFSDHHLRWQGGGVDTRMYKFHARRLALYSLRYGDAVTICPDVYDDFSLIHFSLSGGIEIEADGDKQAIRQGRAIISSPRRNIKLHWTNACEQLILRVPHGLFREAAGRLGIESARAGSALNPGLLLPFAASRQWRHQLDTFMALENYSRQSEAYLPWLEHLEAGMAMFLMLQATDGRREPAKQEAASACGSQGLAARRLDRLYEFAMNSLTRPVTLADLARAAALSERQLNTFCHERLGMPPVAWLRGMRLDAVREVLQADPRADIAATAMLHGFDHLGRFAGYYRRRFGELPSETAKSARTGYAGDENTVSG